ncbi:MAG: polyprenyl synthetase family protein [Bifidobacteriaceae bacterium]|jgi:geranylgeranyl pyrophosphate synthase|nr:polyprenyl synthetase family protein [Bifidobacteriaceae bacterium]
MNKLESYIYKYLTRDLDSSLQSIVKHYIKSPGKHIRAHLVLYGASISLKENSLKWKTLNKEMDFFQKINLAKFNDNLILACSLIEIIHLASLVHDDIIDDAPKRRNQTALHIRRSTKQAILAGDYLFAKAINLAHQLPTACKKHIVKAIQDMVYGEFLEAVSDKANKEKYFTIIENKTASLFGCSMLIGFLIAQDAILDNESSELISYEMNKNKLVIEKKEIANKIYKWAFNLGKLYQIKDDIDDQEFPF